MMRARAAPLVLCLVACACSRRTPRREPAAADAGPVVVRVDPSLLGSGRIATGAVERRALRGDVRLPAEVVPSESGAAEVGALVAGRVGSIEVKEGDAVKKGQALATVDSPDAARIAADAIRARARIAAASKKLERQEGLAADEATSASAVDEARVELAQARADAAAARTLLAGLGIPEPSGDAAVASRVPLRSPIDGVVTERMTTLGASVAPEKTLFRVVARDRVYVDVRFTDPAMSIPEKGSPVRVLPRGADAKTSCPAHIAASLGVVDERTRARRVRVDPDAPCELLVPGAFVDAAFTSPASTVALAIPKAALVDVRGAPTVFLATPEPGAFSPRVVRTGTTTSEDVAIEEGLSEGDRVVVVGAVLLKGELLRAELE
jgi:cobalt-zinc-cadmium efflux system membrane fusion protein